jgi:hypothetical protein
MDGRRRQTTVSVTGDSIRAHTALVSAAFACPQDFKIKQEHLDAHFRSLTFLQQGESGILRAIPIEPDLHTILGMIKDRSVELKKFEDFFIGRPLPMGVFANRIGRSLFQTWVSGRAGRISPKLNS